VSCGEIMARSADWKGSYAIEERKREDRKHDLLLQI
jgi:hypothetical protein